MEEKTLSSFACSSYLYWLELDASGNILGGTFSTWDRVDFVWAPKEVLGFTGYFASLATIYNASTNQLAADIDDRNVISAPSRWSRSTSYAKRGELSHLDSNEGTFSSPHPYRSSWKHAWSIKIDQPKSEAVLVEIVFDRFETERTFDQVKIFENSDGTGPLLATLHGTIEDDSKRTIAVRIDSRSSDGVMITFGSDAKIEKYGFDASYTVRSA